MRFSCSALVNFLLVASPTLVLGGNTVNNVGSGDDGTWNSVCEDNRSRTAHERGVGFKDRTAVTIHRDEPQDEVLFDDQGTRYRRRNLRAQSRSEGLIFLSEGRCFISDVECSSDPSTLTITIEEGNEFDVEELGDLFPVDSLVVVQARTFGDCDLGQETPDFNIFPFDVPLNGYLLVESVEASLVGNQQEITITGEPTSWWSGFDELEYDIDREATEDSENAACVDGALIDNDFDIPVFSIIGHRVASLTANVCVDIKDSGVKDFSVRVNRRNFGVAFTTVLDVYTETSLTFSFLDYDGDIEVLQRIFPAIPIAALPPAFNTLDMFGDLNNNMLAGIYFDMPLVLEGRHRLADRLDYSSFIGYNTGRKETRFEIGNNGVRSTNLLDEAGSAVDYGFRASDAGNSEMDSRFFLGLQPAIGLFSSTIFAGFRIDIGTIGDHDWMGANLGSFPAITSGLRNDACELAHQFEADVDFKVRKLRAEMDVAIKVGFLFLTVFKYADTLTFTFIESLLDLDLGRYCI